MPIFPRHPAALAEYNRAPSYRRTLDREQAGGPADVALVGSEEQIFRAMSALAESGADELAPAGHSKLMTARATVPSRPNPVDYGAGVGTGNDTVHTPRMRRSQDEVRYLLLSAARRRLEEHGYAGVSTRAVAADANASPSLIFSYFGNPPTDAVKKVMAQAPPQAAALLFTDDPPHRRHRELVQQAFSARRVAKLEESIAATTTEILDEVIPRGRVELMTEFAQRLPITVIADALGVPRADIGTFTIWSDAIAAPAGRALSEPEHLECARHYVDFMAYFAEQIAVRREKPGDDLLTDLVRAEVAGADPLSDSELLTIVAQILTAGNQTTAKAIGFTMQLLLDRPELLDTVQADPDRLADVIEESLRLESPVQLMLRVTTREVEIGGSVLPAGALIMLVFGSANHDEATFPDPDTADIDRPNLRKHLAFSAGIHHCLGAALARAEIRVGLSAFMARARNIRTVEGTGALEPSLILRGPAELHLTFDPVT